MGQTSTEQCTNILPDNQTCADTGIILQDYVVDHIPPESKYGLDVKQPAIYYGENTPGYRIVSTKVKEFDYPQGNQNVFTSYAGRGGIPLESFWKRALFAWTQSDINILLTSYLGPESRIQIWRNVRDRVARVAPFSELDQDPYLVLSEGKLYWIQDAYTVSDRFPYATPYGKALNRLNFINQEDPWGFPQEKYAGSAIRFEPYYILMRLPGSQTLGYLLTTFITPQSRDNMIAWMAAKCDFPRYGHLLVYLLPKKRLTFGPIRIEAMIDQNALIFEQLSLWDRKGSRAIRGNLVVIPIDNSFLYVEPANLQRRPSPPRSKAMAIMI